MCLINNKSNNYLTTSILSHLYATLSGQILFRNCYTSSWYLFSFCNNGWNILYIVYDCNSETKITTEWSLISLTSIEILSKYLKLKNKILQYYYFSLPVAQFIIFLLQLFHVLLFKAFSILIFWRILFKRRAQYLLEDK